MFILRALESADSMQELTVLLNRAYAELGSMGLNYTAVDQSAEVTAQRIRGGQCFVVMHRDRLVGTVLVKPTDEGSDCLYYRNSGVASLRQFGVDPDFRGLGIGLKLIQACENWALSRGFKELALDTAVPAAHLVALYARLGFKNVAAVQWPGKVYESIVMSKNLKGA